MKRAAWYRSAEEEAPRLREPVTMARAVEMFEIRERGEKMSGFNTMDAYMGDLLAFARWTRRQKLTMASHVRMADVLAYLRFLRVEDLTRRPASQAWDGEGPRFRSQRSVRRAQAVLSLFFRFLTREGVIHKNPMACIPVMRFDRKQPLPLSQEEVGRVLAQPDRARPAGLRDAAMLDVMYGCGLRVSEILSLKVKDAGADVLTVYGKGAKERQVPVRIESRRLLIRYTAKAWRLLAVRTAMPEGAPLFVSDSPNARGGRLTRQAVHKLVRWYGAGAGLSGVLTPHTLRHACAAHLMHNGMPIEAVKAFLGHENITTTESYTRVTKEWARQTWTEAHPRLSDRG
jgi:integrase/recombinase XerD